MLSEVRQIEGDRKTMRVESFPRADDDDDDERSADFDHAQRTSNRQAVKLYIIANMDARL